MADYTGTVEPNHTQANFSNDCTQCHTTDGWTPSSFDHMNATGFALNGSHANVNCNQCHANGYTNTPNTCEGCHLTDYNGTTNPNHVTAGFPTDCALCHDEGNWTQPPSTTTTRASR
jgi:DnaJ-class molecular chaperone